MVNIDDSTVILLAGNRAPPKWSSAESNRYILDKFKLNHGTGGSPCKIKGLNRDGLVDLWKGLGYKVGAEVGVDMGVFSNLMFKGIPGLKMYLVDPYAPYKDNARHVKRSPEAKSIAHKAMKGRNVVWIGEMSETAFNKIKDDHWTLYT